MICRPLLLIWGGFLCHAPFSCAYLNLFISPLFSSPCFLLFPLLLLVHLFFLPTFSYFPFFFFLLLKIISLRKRKKKKIMKLTNQPLGIMKKQNKGTYLFNHKKTISLSFTYIIWAWKKKTSQIPLIPRLPDNFSYLSSSFFFSSTSHFLMCNQDNSCVLDPRAGNVAEPLFLCHMPCSPWPDLEKFLGHGNARLFVCSVNVSSPVLLCLCHKTLINKYVFTFWKKLPTILK